jgi:hypothetical protein
VDSGQCGEVIALSINQKGEAKVGKIRFKWPLGVFLIVILGLFSQRIYAGGFYLPEVGSPVDDEDRTIDLPLDEQLKFSMGYATRGKGKWGHAISASAMWFGDGRVDQVAQGARFKGKFDDNWIFIIGANLQYRF